MNEFVRKKIKDTFVKKMQEQCAMRERHVKAERFGAAYLATWCIFESFAKEIAPECQRAELRVLLNEWQSFLDGTSQNKPKPISSGKFDLSERRTQRIPSDGLLSQLVATEDAVNFYELINSGKKFRKRRNAIAHSGEEPSKDVYLEFDMKAQRAISEIEVWFENM